jgi:hypothetical protein
LANFFRFVLAEFLSLTGLSFVFSSRRRRCPFPFGDGTVPSVSESYYLLHENAAFIEKRLFAVFAEPCPDLADLHYVFMGEAALELGKVLFREFHTIGRCFSVYITAE